MKIPAINTNGEVVMLRTKDILCIKSRERKSVPVIHTIKGEYYPIITLRDFSRLLCCKGFMYTEKSSVVNMNRVVKLNVINRTLSFDKKYKVEDCGVSREKMKEIEAYIAN